MKLVLVLQVTQYSMHVNSSASCAICSQLGGIVKPNDGVCHMENGFYSESLSQVCHSVVAQCVYCLLTNNPLRVHFICVPKNSYFSVDKYEYE